MFERFAESAREVVVQAQHEADGLGHNYIGTEHLLLGLARDDGAAGETLRSLGISSDRLRARTKLMLGMDAVLDEDALATIGIDLDEVRRRVEAAFGPGALERTRSGKRLRRSRCMTPRAKKVLELSLREALARGDRSVSSQHVLLGIVREGDGLAVRLLEECGVSRERARTELLRAIDAE